MICFSVSSGSAGAILTEADRRRLEAQLKRLVPGTRVDAQGNVNSPEEYVDQSQELLLRAEEGEAGKR